MSRLPVSSSSVDTGQQASAPESPDSRPRLPTGPTSSSRPKNPICVGVRMVNHVDGALEEFELWEMEPLYMVVLPTPKVVERMFVEDRYVDIDFSLLASDDAEPRQVCFGLVYRLMLQQFMLKATRERLFSEQTDAAEERKRENYGRRLTEDYERLKRKFRRYYSQRLIGTPAVRKFRLAALNVESAWMKAVWRAYPDIDLVNEVVWLETV